MLALAFSLIFRGEMLLRRIEWDVDWVQLLTWR
jgi:hypothetical protein